MNPEGADTNREHEYNPNPADRTMRDRSFGRAQLDDAQSKSRHGRESVKPYGAVRGEQWSESHWGF